MTRKRKSAAIYTRISDDATGRGAGVKRQQADCEALCEARGWPVASVHVDNDRSAYSGKRRPEYERLLDGIEAGRYDAVVIWHPDRLHRSPSELERFIDLVEQTDVEVATVTAGDLDLSTPDGRLVARIVGSVARKESEDKSRRIRRSHREIAEQGRPSGGGRRPFGYEPDKITVRESEAAEIRKAVDAILGGASLRSIAMDWTERGVETSTGATHWSRNTIRRILTSARIAGQREHNGAVTDAVWPAIIDPDELLRVRAMLASKPATRTSKRSHLLSGMVRCGRCGDVMGSAPVKRRSDGARVDRYKCKVDAGGCGRCGIVASPVEAIVVEKVLHRLDNPKLAQAQADHDPGDADDQTDVIRELEGRMDDLAAMFADGEISRSEWSTARDRIADRLADAQRVIAEEAHATARTATLDFGPLRDEWPDLDLEARRQVIAAVIDHVEIEPTIRSANQFDPDRVGIVWRD